MFNGDLSLNFFIEQGKRWHFVVLFGAYQPHDDGDVVDGVAWEFEGFVFLVFRDYGDGVWCRSLLHLFNKRSLFGVNDIDFSPLEEDVGEREHLARDEIAGEIARCHGVATDSYEEVGVFECRHDVAVTFLHKYGLRPCEASCHSFDRYERNARAVVGWNDCRLFLFEHVALAGNKPTCRYIRVYA